MVGKKATKLTACLWLRLVVDLADAEPPEPRMVSSDDHFPLGTERARGNGQDDPVVCADDHDHENYAENCEDPGDQKYPLLLGVCDVHHLGRFTFASADAKPLFCCYFPKQLTDMKKQMIFLLQQSSFALHKGSPGKRRYEYSL